MNVTTKQICIGCGVCAGVCPTLSLRMADNEFGEYRPYGTETPCSDCGLCKAVCPFEHGPNEDELGRELYTGVPGIQHTKETGYYLSSFVGGVADEGRRWSRTSGGLATWMLVRLMESGVVDRVIAVASTSDPDRLFDFAEFPNVKSLWTAARSSYYPVEISSCLRSITHSGLRYAVIGLPCVVKGIRRAQGRMPALRKSIPVLLGLVCGQQRSKFLAEYLIRRAGLALESTRRVSFREKRQKQPAYLTHFAAWTVAGTGPHYVERREGYGHAWGQSYFKQDACNYCDDVFAELADAVFMDAWLPGFHGDPRGTSIALTRSSVCDGLLAAGRDSDKLAISPLPIGEVVRSQEGVLQLKQDGAAVQLSLNGNHVAEFSPRVRPASPMRITARFRKAAENRRMAVSRSALSGQRKAGCGLEVFNRAMAQATCCDSVALGALRLAALPKRAGNKALRMLRGALRPRPTVGSADAN